MPKRMKMKESEMEGVDEKALYQQQFRETTELLDHYLKDIC